MVCYTVYVIYYMASSYVCIAVLNIISVTAETERNADLGVRSAPPTSAEFREETEGRRKAWPLLATPP